MRGKRLAITIGVLAALASLAVAGTVLAQTPDPEQNNARANYREFFLDRLAAQLQVTREELASAFEQAKDETIDRAAEDGRITEAQAERLKERSGLAPFHLVPPGQRLQRPPHPAIPLLLGAEMRSAIAEALGMTEDELADALRSGKSLRELAGEQGVDEAALMAAILEHLRGRLDSAVDNGRLTQEEANRIYSRLQNADLLDLGRLRLEGPRGWWGEWRERMQETRPLRGASRSGAATL